LQGSLNLLLVPPGEKEKKVKRVPVYLGIALLAWQLISGGPVSAAQNINQADAPVMEEVVVTATRHEEQLTAIPASVTIFTEKDIKSSSAQSVPEFLRNQAGVQIYDISGNRRTYTVDLRGFGETATLNSLVLVDGRRVTQPDLSGSDWALVPLERIKKIEIIRGGSGSVLYGDNAAGGVVNIITKEGEAFKTRAELSAGSYNTRKANAYIGGNGKNLDYLLSGSYLKSDGYRANSQTEAGDAGINVNYYQGEHFKLNLSSGYHRDNTGLPGALKDSDFAAGKKRTDTINPNDFAKTEDYYLKASPEIYFWGDSLMTLDVSFRQRDFQSVASGSWGNFLGQTKLETVDLAPRVVLKKAVGGLANSLTAGVDFHDVKEGITNDSTFFGSRSLNNYTLKKEEYGYYIHDELSLLKNLILSGGYRNDRVHFTFDPGTPESVKTGQEAYTAGVNYLYSGKSYLYASYAKGFRYPVLDEFFSFISNTVSSSLTPQQSDDYELGLRHYVTEAMVVHLNFFRMDIKNEIFFNPSTYANENLDGLTRRQGVE
jgi:iron complex outermembrane receptor protein